MDLEGTTGVVYFRRSMTMLADRQTLWAAIVDFRRTTTEISFKNGTTVVGYRDRTVVGIR